MRTTSAILSSTISGVIESLITSQYPAVSMYTLFPYLHVPHSTISYLFLWILLILNVDARHSSDSRRSGSSSRGSGSRGSGSRGSGSKGSSSRGSGSRSRDRGDDEAGCCYGTSSRCNTDDKATCEEAQYKGCQWKSGADANCDTMWTTVKPTGSPTMPTPAPSMMTNAPSTSPTAEPSMEPTLEPTANPSFAPSFAPSLAPNNAPTGAPSPAPTGQPTPSPTPAPTGQPTPSPTVAPTTPLPTGKPFIATPDPNGGPVLSNGSVECDDASHGAWLWWSPCYYGAVADGPIKCRGCYSCMNGWYRSIVREWISLISEEYIECDGAVSCIGTGLIADGSVNCGGLQSCYSSPIESGDAVYCRGKQSCHGPSNITARTIECSAAESCIENTYRMSAREEIYCDAEASCSGSKMYAPVIQCDGEASCTDGFLHSLEVFCRGKDSCAGATIGKLSENGDAFNVSVSGYQGAAASFIVGAALIEATGAESIINAWIESAADSEMMVILSGENAGTSAVAQCKDNSECTFLCNDEACGGFSVHCEDATLCTFGSGFSPSNFEEIDCVSNSGSNVVTSSGDNVICPAVTYDVATVQRPALKQHAVVVDSVESVLNAHVPNDQDGPADGYCLEAHECPDAIFQSGYAQCNGYQACERVTIGANTYPECGGVESCIEGTFSKSIPCSAKGSCRWGQYTGESDFEMDCSAEGSCEDMTKADSWEKVDGVNHRFECSGYESCKMAEMVNVEMCSGANSCHYMEMDEASGDVACLGKYSCSAAYFHGNITGDVYCEGYQACQRTRLYEQKDLYCDGYESCGGTYCDRPCALTDTTQIRSAGGVIYARGERALAGTTISSCNNDMTECGDLTIYASGKDAMNGVQLVCFGGITCNLHCHGDSCSNLDGNGSGKYWCFTGDGTVCNCQGTGCPEYIDGHPDAMNLFPKQEMYAFDRMGMNVMDNSFISMLNEMNESMMLFVGAGAVVMVLMAIFYFVRRSGKGEYEPLE